MLRRSPRFLLLCVCSSISIYGYFFSSSSFHSCAQAAFVRGRFTTYYSHRNNKQSVVVTFPSLLFSSKQKSSSKDWNDSFQLYLNHTRDTGDRNVPLAHPELGNWVRLQRIHHKQYQAGETCPLTNERFQKLEEAGFVFDVQFYLWKKSYDELAQYYNSDHNGQYAAAAVGGIVGNSPLGRWASTQRRLYREGLLPEDRKTLLNDLDFWCWDLKEQSYREKIAQIKNMTKPTKKTKLAWELKPQDGPLGLWMCNQRTRYRKYCQGANDFRLEPYQIDLLENELEMDCETCRERDRQLFARDPIDITWDQRMHQLRKYQAKHGHVNVPRTYTGSRNLGLWVAKVRERYVNYNDDSPAYLQKRVRELQSMGFVWDLHEYRWQKKYEALIDYYEQYGDANVPDSQGSLGPWVKEQRQEYHKFRKGIPSRLTPSHALALQRMGLDWNRRATKRRKQEETFRERVKEYRECCLEYQEKENNDSARPSASSLPKSLQYWVERQRNVYRQWLRGDKMLSEERRRLLEEAGVVYGIAEQPKK